MCRLFHVHGYIVKSQFAFGLEGSMLVYMLLSIDMCACVYVCMYKHICVFVCVCQISVTVTK